MRVVFSPRAWGWSATAGAFYPTAWVLPTRVGMVRSRHPAPEGLGVLPTRVGMVRLLSTGAAAIVTFSPRAWGWSELRHEKTAVPPFSPRAWGWSALRFHWRLRSHVLPTRVGMVRRFSMTWGQHERSPHARGDGPP